MRKKRYINEIFIINLIFRRDYSEPSILVKEGNTYYVVVVDSNQGPLSKPINLKISNIHPGHVVD